MNGKRFQPWIKIYIEHFCETDVLRLLRFTTFRLNQFL